MAKPNGESTGKRRGPVARRPKEPAGSPAAESAEAPKQVSFWKSKETKIAILSAVLAGVVSILVALAGKAFPGGPQADSSKTAVTTRSPSPSKGGPLRVAQVRYVPRRADRSWIMAAALDPATLGPLNRRVEQAGGAQSDAADPVMRAAGGVDPTVSTVELELEGNRPSPVLINDIRVVAQCRKPLNGTLFYNSSQGQTDTVKLGFDLDSPSPIAQYVKDRESGLLTFHGDYFADHKYTLNQGDQVTFRLAAHSDKGYCEYRYRLDVLVDGHPYSQIIDDSGRPFKVTAEILLPNDRCHPYRRTYVSKWLARGNVDELPPWTEAEKSRGGFC